MKIIPKNARPAFRRRNRLTCRRLVPLGLFCLACFFSPAPTLAADDPAKTPAQETPPAVSPSPDSPAVPARQGNTEAAAVVGGRKITAEEIFAGWNRKWREIQAKVRNGLLDAADGDDLLQEEWKRVVNAAIKEEVLYQTAKRDYHAKYEAIVDEQNYTSAKPRHQVAEEVRRRLKEEQDKILGQLRTKAIKEAGGAVSIQMHLEAMGVSPEEWLTGLEKKAFVQMYLRQVLVMKEPEPGPREIRDYYDRHPEEFMQPGPVRFRHILLANLLRGPEEARENAVEIWEHLADQTITFQEAAKDYSDDRISSEHGGEESGEESGVAEREAWLRDVRLAAGEEKPGRLAPIFASPFGYHILELISVGAAKKQSFYEVQRDIGNILRDERWEREVDRHYQAIRRSVPVQVALRRFPKELSCAALGGRPWRAPCIINLTRPEIELLEITRR